MQVKRYLGIAALALLMACNNAAKQETSTKDSTTTAATEQVAAAGVSFKDPKQAAIYTAYIDLKDALVTADAAKAQTAAKALAATLKSQQGCENTAVIAGKIEATKDLAVQRKEFTALSTDVIAMFKHAELNAGAIYVQHCPMANKGDGGDWLASEKKIQNPYYGSEMMDCGAVVEEIKAK